MNSTTINEIINNPNYHNFLSIFKGFRNGLIYGAKIRLPHALVMTFLFSNGDLRTKLKNILKATKQHSFNLAKFVTIYKTLLFLQKRFNNNIERSSDSFFAGLVGGYMLVSHLVHCYFT